MLKSLNNKVICEPASKETEKHEKGKLLLVNTHKYQRLKVLVDTNIYTNGSWFAVRAGEYVFIRYFANATVAPSWYKEVYSSDALSGFIVVPIEECVMAESP